jgi:16S rRNA processing protein RimM
VGTVVDIIAAGNNLLEVKFDPGFAAERAGKTVLIPFVREIVPIVDLSSRRLEINPPPGLLEITSQ